MESTAWSKWSKNPNPFKLLFHLDTIWQIDLRSPQHDLHDIISKRREVPTNTELPKQLSLQLVIIVV